LANEAKEQTGNTMITHKRIFIGLILLLAVIMLGGAAAYYFKFRYDDPAFKVYVQNRRYCDGIRNLKTSQAEMYRDWKQNILSC
jgi:hypothetical protein